MKNKNAMSLLIGTSLMILVISLFYENNFGTSYNLMFFTSFTVLLLIPIKIQLIVSGIESYSYGNEPETDGIIGKLIRRGLDNVYEQYKRTFDKNLNTRVKAEIFFTEDNVFDNSSFLPFALFEQSSSIFTGLGLIGTFLGISKIFSQNDGCDIVSLLGSFDMVFNTSIIGVCLSIIYNHFIFSHSQKSLREACQMLSLNFDERHYKTDVAYLESAVAKLASACDIITSLPINLEKIDKNISKDVVSLERISSDFDAIQKKYEKCVNILDDVPGSIQLIFNTWDKAIKNNRRRYEKK